jgi:hypothetical protein
MAPAPNTQIWVAHQREGGGGGFGQRGAEPGAQRGVGAARIRRLDAAGSDLVDVGRHRYVHAGDAQRVEAGDLTPEDAASGLARHRQAGRAQLREKMIGDRQHRVAAMADGGGRRAPFAHQPSRLAPQMQCGHDHAVPGAHRTLCRLDGRDVAAMAAHHQQPRAAAGPQRFEAFQGDRRQRGGRERDAARDTSKEILAAEGNGRRHQRVIATGGGGARGLHGHCLGQQPVAHRRGRAVRLGAAHGQNEGGARGDPRRHLGRAQPGYGVRHLSYRNRSTAIRLSACTPRPIQASSGW